jgi:hypothetical protein
MLLRLACLLLFQYAHQIVEAVVERQGWVDISTTVKDMVSQRDGRRMTLVASDEFHEDNRSFQPGDDPLFEAITMPDVINDALQFCMFLTIVARSNR